jgi:membrane fusion protein, multidrug efflux system
MGLRFLLCREAPFTRNAKMATRHRSIKSPLLLSLLATGVLSACGEPPGGPQMGVQGTPQVAVVTLQTQSLPLTTELPGRVSPASIAEVRPQVTGLIQARRFQEGTTVKAGDLLYQINSATYRASVDSAQAAVAKAQAQLVTTKLKAERLKELAAMKAAGQQDADDAHAALLQAEAELMSAKAALQTQRINLDYTRVVSPISGRIGRSSVTQGALVTANQAAALATVQQMDPIYVDVTQPSAAQLSLGQALASGKLKAGSTKVTLQLENGSTYELPGKLKASEVTVDQNTGAVTLRAEFPNPKGALLPGMYVRAVVEEGIVDNALLVPQTAVSRDSSGKPVAFVVDADGKLAQRAIQTSRAVGNQWLVSRGLQAGDRLAVEGQQKARPGMVVEAKPFLASKN